MGLIPFGAHLGIFGSKRKFRRKDLKFSGIIPVGVGSPRIIFWGKNLLFEGSFLNLGELIPWELVRFKLLWGKGLAFWGFPGYGVGKPPKFVVQERVLATQGFWGCGKKVYFPGGTIFYFFRFQREGIIPFFLIGWKGEFKPLNRKGGREVWGQENPFGHTFGNHSFPP